MNADDTLDHTVPSAGNLPVLRLCPRCGRRTADALCPDDHTTTVPMTETNAADPFVGRVLDGRFRIVRRIGQGGMGRVYLATQLNLDARVAIKVILSERQASDGAVQRFHREARASTRLTSPHVVRVYDFGLDDQTTSPYLVMEYLEGRTLAGLLSTEGALPPQRAALITAQILRALVDAEARSIVHRDLKPENVFLVQNGEQSDFVKVMDFGVARSVSGTPDGLGSLTQNGHIVGTPAYMSPEQISGQAVDTRSDLYAVGCLLHELLTGSPPYAHTDEGIPRMLAHVTEPPPALPPLSACGDPVPDAVRSLHDRLLAKAAADRPATAARALELLVASPREAPLLVDALAAVDTATQPTVRTAPVPDPPGDSLTVPAAPGPLWRPRRGRAAAAVAVALLVALATWAAGSGRSGVTASPPAPAPEASPRGGEGDLTAEVEPPEQAAMASAALAALAPVATPAPLTAREPRDREAESSVGARREPATWVPPSPVVVRPVASPVASSAPRPIERPALFRADKPGRRDPHHPKHGKKHRKNR